MPFARSFGEQLARPRGWAGRLLGSAMDLANRRPARLAIDLLSPQAGECLLDAGCGTGAASLALLQSAPCRVEGVDRSQTMLAMARRRVERHGLSDRCSLQQGDLTCLDAASASFDGILALNVLYFCGSDSAMIAELRRVLRPGGRLAAYVTARSTMEGWAFARSGTHRLFDAAELRAALVMGGFATERIRIEALPITRKVTGLFALAEA